MTDTLGLTNRWYYTDPLAAAWMAAHHNMRFNTNKIGFSYCYKTNDLIPSPQIDVWEIVRDTFSIDAGYGSLEHEIAEKYYIHPDSLHLLEPQDGDIALDADGGAGEYRAFSSKWGCFYGCGRDCEGMDTRLPFKIIQRNGLAFHWPESEAV